MAVLRKEDGIPDYDTMHELEELEELEEMMHGKFAKHITIMDTGHGNTQSKNTTRFVADDEFVESLRYWYKYRSNSHEDNWH